MRNLIKVGTSNYGGLLENDTVIYYWSYEDKNDLSSDFDDLFKILGINIVNSDDKQHIKTFVNFLIDNDKFL